MTSIPVMTATTTTTSSDQRQRLPSTFQTLNSTSLDGRLDINVSIGGGAARVPSDYDYHHYTELDERAMDENTVEQRQTLPDTYDRLFQREAPHEYASVIPNSPNVSQDGHVNTETTESAAHDYLAPQEYASVIPSRPNVSQDAHMNTETTESAAHDYLTPQEYASVIPNRPNVNQDAHYMNTETTGSGAHDYLEVIADPHYENDI